jgi:hypothetical protein
LIWGVVMEVRSIDTLRRATRESMRSPAVSRLEEAALVMEAEAREIGEGGGGVQEP